MDAASMPPSLIRGATDAGPFFVVHEARIRKVAKQQNADIRVLTAWADLGLDLASTSLVAREETIAKDPVGLKAFLKATLKGADYAFRGKHFDEGVGYVLKHHPEVDPDGALAARAPAGRRAGGRRSYRGGWSGPRRAAGRACDRRNGPHRAARARECSHACGQPPRARPRRQLDARGPSHQRPSKLWI